MPGQNDTRIDIESMTIVGGHCEALRVIFGPHHFVEIERGDTGLRFRLGTTHHGFEADASEVSSQLESLISEVRQAHPDLCID